MIEGEIGGRKYREWFNFLSETQPKYTSHIMTKEWMNPLLLELLATRWGHKFCNLEERIN